MSKKSRSGMPSRLEIAKAWLNSTDPLDAEVVREFGQTPQECNLCWRCGGTPGGYGIERAHILAHSQDGGMEPLNLMLLCVRCHKKQPDGMDRRTQLEWVCRGESQNERRADFEPIFLAAGTTAEEFVERHGENSVAVITEMFKAAMQVTAGNSNWKGNLSAMMRDKIR